VNSIDTNIFLYAINSDCQEHREAHALILEALERPAGWIIADQVWFELYRLLRNPKVLAEPLDATRAADTIHWYRQKSGWLSCAWEPDMMHKLLPLWRNGQYAPRNSFDLILAVTLASHGVDTFYTRNTRGFEACGFFTLHNPIESF
jgi:uncharacterized protein